MTDSKPAKPAARKQAAKQVAAKKPAAKAPVTKAPATKAAAAKPASAKAATAKATVAKSTAAKTSALAPVEPTPVVVAPAAATAPAGWYPVAAGSAQLRYWDGNAWTDHVHNPAVPQSTPAHVRLKAPEGTSPTTVWFWLVAASPAITAVSYIFLSVFFTQAASQYTFLDSSATFDDSFGNPAYLTSVLVGILALVVAILFGILDWRTLEKRGVPKPFHWAWSLMAIAVSSPIVYVIGRTVVAKRRTGKGMAPLWVFIVLQVVAWVIGIVAIVVFFVALFAGFLSIFNDSNEVF